jgi:phosphoribosylformylglycinamidine synthase
MAQLVRACRGLHEACVAYRTPLVSGKDSMKNESTMGGVKISVPPTLLVSAMGQIDDVRTAVTLEPKRTGDVVFLLGRTADETGAGEYLRYRGTADGLRAKPGEPSGYVGNKVPRVDVAETLPLYEAFETAVRAGIVRSAATPAMGGWALAFARCAMAAETGMELDLDAYPDAATLAPDTLLFSESNGRFLVTVAPEDAGRFAAHFAEGNCTRVGTVTDETRLRVRIGGTLRVDLEVEAMKRAFKETLADD